MNQETADLLATLLLMSKMISDINFLFYQENTKKIIDRLLLSKSVSFIPYLPTTYSLNKEVIYNFSILQLLFFQLFS